MYLRLLIDSGASKDAIKAERISNMDKIKATLTKPVSSADNPEQPKNQEIHPLPSELG